MIKKFARRILVLILLLSLGMNYVILRGDLKTLEDGLIRLHVVGASDSAEDQAAKLLVRDEVTDYLRQAMDDLPDAEAALSYLRGQLPELQRRANRVLRELGFMETAEVSLGQEEFPTRVYDTFRLPAGIYETLRITIGEGLGHNWWCVLFPSLCLPAASETFAETAAGAGISPRLADTLENPDYELRFRLLDLLGEVRCYFHSEETKEKTDASTDIGNQLAQIQGSGAGTAGGGYQTAARRQSADGAGAKLP